MGTIHVQRDGRPATQTELECAVLGEPLPPTDTVNHPAHYTQHPSGVECITITEHMSFCIGNAIKYLWRADLKRDAVEDLKKAQWYLAREIHRREAGEVGGE